MACVAYVPIVESRSNQVGLMRLESVVLLEHVLAISHFNSDLAAAHWCSLLCCWFEWKKLLISILQMLYGEGCEDMRQAIS
jgi:hypothetical protein